MVRIHYFAAMVTVMQISKKKFYESQVEYLRKTFLLLFYYFFITFLLNT